MPRGRKATAPSRGRSASAGPKGRSASARAPASSSAPFNWSSSPLQGGAGSTKGPARSKFLWWGSDPAPPPPPPAPVMPQGYIPPQEGKHLAVEGTRTAGGAMQSDFGVLRSTTDSHGNQYWVSPTQQGNPMPNGIIGYNDVGDPITGFTEGGAPTGVPRTRGGLMHGDFEVGIQNRQTTEGTTYNQGDVISGTLYTPEQFLESNPGIDSWTAQQYSDWYGKQTAATLENGVDVGGGDGVSWGTEGFSGSSFDSHLKLQSLIDENSPANRAAALESSSGGTGTSALDDFFGEGGGLSTLTSGLKESFLGINQGMQGLQDQIASLQDQPQGLDPSLMLALLQGNNQEDDSGNLFMSGVF